jgi:hypothetical protein
MKDKRIKWVFYFDFLLIILILSAITTTIAVRFQCVPQYTQLGHIIYEI